jgi:hypothetical protein
MHPGFVRLFPPELCPHFGFLEFPFEFKDSLLGARFRRGRRMRMEETVFGSSSTGSPAVSVTVLVVGRVAAGLGLIAREYRTLSRSWFVDLMS